MSVEQQLARITAQSHNADPKHVPGGKPELTADDIRAGVSFLSSHQYHALMAKWCDDDQSKKTLARLMYSQSLKRFVETYPDKPTKGSDHHKLVLHSIKYFLAPAKGEKLTDEQHAGAIGVSRKTFTGKYRYHVALLVSVLQQLESDGRRALRRALK